MQKFEITYKGEIANVIKEDKGSYYVALPARFGNSGDEFHESITREKDGWKFSSAINGKPDYYFYIWLKDDGTMAYKNDLMEEVKVSDERFNPDLLTDDPVHSICQDIYDVVKSIYEYEKFGVPSAEIIDLRRRRLLTTLQLLGYSGGKLDDTLTYLPLGRIGKQLEDYINLAAYVQSGGKQDGREVYELKFPKEGVNKEEFQAMIDFEKAKLQEDLAFIEAQNEQNEMLRYIVPDFCMGMSDKILSDEWNVYSKVVQDTVRLYLELNSDLIPYGQRTKLTNSTTLTGHDLADRISRLIDSREFSKACNIEDKFVMRESERFSEHVTGMLDESERVRESSVGAALVGLQREALSTRDKRQKYVSRYEEMQRVYFSAMPKDKNTRGKEEPDDE